MSTPPPEPSPEPTPHASQPTLEPDPEATQDMPEAGEPALEGAVVGEYVVEGRIGRGAFGTVYRGVHPLIGKAVAIKVLARRFSVDPEMVSRFVAEARAVNQIRHRHIIDIFSFGQLDDGRHYYVMEYLEGETLHALLEREHRLPVGRCLAILPAIGRALDAAHAKGIAHRDLKAENIFLGTDPDGAVWPKLLDFGIAKLSTAEVALKHRTRSGMSIGTPLYMSPEQCHGRQVDHRTDIYAFGIVVYLMLTGGFPFDGDGYMEILMKQVGAAAVPPSVHVPALPKAIDAVVLWMLHKDPAQRPPDLRTAVAALEQAGLIAPAGDTGGVHAQPTKLPVIGVVSLAAVTAIVAAVVAWYPRAEDAPRARSPVGASPAGTSLQAAHAASGREAAQETRGPSGWTTRGAPGHLAQGTRGLSGQEPVQATPGRSGHEAAHGTPGASGLAAVPVPAGAVVITIDGVPAGTEVFAGGVRIGTAPGQVAVPAGAAVVLTLKAAGYVPVRRSIAPDRDRALSLTMVKQRPGGRAGKRPTRDDIIDVFGGDRP